MSIVLTQCVSQYSYNDALRYIAAVEADIATFSLAALDPDSGALGVAVASKFLAVGAYVPFVRAEVGAVATQARTNLSYGPRVLELLEDGHSPAAASELVRAGDPGASRRQLGIVTADGASHSFTGADCTAWAGGASGPGFAAQGNILTGPEVLDALVAEWTGSAELPFARRLLAALTAAERAGGDSRGRQAAALVVSGGAQDVNLRVDDHAEPLAELLRLLSLADPPERMKR